MKCIIGCNRRMVKYFLEFPGNPIICWYPVDSTHVLVRRLNGLETLYELDATRIPHD